MNDNQRYLAIRNTTIIGAIANGILAILQLIGGLLAHSHALLADGLHTLSDLASDSIVLIAAKFANKDADDDHPYGHARIETLATILLGTILCAVAVAIFWNTSAQLLSQQRFISPSPLAIGFAVLAVIVKEGLYQYTVYEARRVRSPLLEANAWHHRSDSISSFIVILGLCGAIFLNITWLDLAAAIVVSLFILFMGVKILLESFAELIDTALAPDQIKKIEHIIMTIDGVNNIHMLRSRKMAGNSFLDLHIQVDSKISVSEGHHIAERVSNTLKETIDHIKDITVHIDPEDDEEIQSNCNLPNREELWNILTRTNSHLVKSIHKEQLVIHYYDSKIDIDLLTHQPIPLEQQELLKTVLLDIQCVHHVTIYQQTASFFKNDLNQCIDKENAPK